MMTALKLALCAISSLIGATAFLTPSVEDYMVKERHAVPQAWKAIGFANKDEMISLQIGLKQRNEDLIERHLIEISDPHHERYGMHLTAAEVADIIRPHDDSISQVHGWLEGHAIDDIHYSPAKDWITVIIPIEKAESLLQTTYTRYEHRDGHLITRAPEWSLPAHLHELVEIVQPTSSFLMLKGGAEAENSGHSLKKRNIDETWKELDGTHIHGENRVRGGDVADPSFCNTSFVTMNCLRTLYGTVDYKAQAADKNSIGINNYLNQTSRRNDIAQYLKEFRPEAASAADEFDIVTINGGSNYQGSNMSILRKHHYDIEGNVDSQLVLGISYPTKMKAFNTGGRPPFQPTSHSSTNTNEPYLEFLNYALAQEDLPYVISSSYGDDEQSVPYSYAKRTCAAFAQLGARGVSYLVSSGDAGVGADGTCQSSDSLNTTKFTAVFPSSCPWVTSVGGTANFAPETAAESFASGGGFSNYFAAPDYQRTTVDRYIKSLNGTHDGLYNKTGRAYPDVAAQCDNHVFVRAGEVDTFSGTSASSPTFAAIIALVNDALLARDKRPLGFLNPWLYNKAYTALNDITIGSSHGCNTTGFPAQRGWDAVTGWGSPNFQKLLELALGRSVDSETQRLARCSS